MTPEQLKASILKYAMQGKLVEQKPEDGTGEDLFCKIGVCQGSFPQVLKITTPLFPN